MMARALPWLVRGYCCLAVEMTLVHWVGGAVGAFQIVALRRTGGFALVGTVWAANGRVSVRSTALGVQVTRGVLSGLGFLGYLYNYSHVPLADATALSYTSAIFLTAIGAVVLGERVGARRRPASPLASSEHC